MKPAKPKIVGDYSNIHQRMLHALDDDSMMLAYGRRVAIMGDENQTLEELTFKAAVYTFASKDDEDESIKAAVLAGRDEDGLLKLAVVDTLPVAGLMPLQALAGKRSMDDAREAAGVLALGAWRTLSEDEFNAFVSWYKGQFGRKVGESRASAPAWLVPYLDMAIFIYNRNAMLGEPAATLLPVLGKDTEAGLKMLEAIASLDNEGEDGAVEA